MPRKTFWQFKNSTSPDAAELDIFDEIGAFGLTAQQFRAELNAVTSPNLRVNINSPGGDIMDGLAIYNLLKACPANVEVHIMGMAASMASVIACAGDKVCMPENTFLFVHEPWNLVAGDAEELRSEADMLDKFGAAIVSAYAAKSGQSPETCAGWMEAETLFSAAEAKAAGLCDEVEPASQAAANAKAQLREYFPKAGEKISHPRVDKKIIVTPSPISPPPIPSPSAMNLLTQITDEFGSNAANLQAACAFAKANSETTIEKVREHVAAKAKDAELATAQAKIAELNQTVSTNASELAKAKADLDAANLTIAKGRAAGGVPPVNTGVPPDDSKPTGAQRPNDRFGKPLKGLAFAAHAFNQQPAVIEFMSRQGPAKSLSA